VTAQQVAAEIRITVAWPPTVGWPLPSRMPERPDHAVSATGDPFSTSSVVILTNQKIRTGIFRASGMVSRSRFGSVLIPDGY
jgi:hypothetical protein